jgi:hypothetical protein
VSLFSPPPIAGQTRTRQGQHRLGVGLPQPHCAAPPSSRPPPHRDTRDKASPAHARPANPSRVHRSDPSASQHARVCPSCCPRPNTQRESESIRVHRVTPPSPLHTHAAGTEWAQLGRRASALACRSLPASTRSTSGACSPHPSSLPSSLSPLPPLSPPPSPSLNTARPPPSPPPSILSSLSCSLRLPESPSISSSESPALPSHSAPSALSLLSLRLLLFPLPSPCSPCRAGRPPALPPAARRRLAPAPSLAGLAAEASLAPRAATACAFISTLHQICFLLAIVHPLAPSSAPPGCVRVCVCVTCSPAVKTTSATPGTRCWGRGWRGRRASRRSTASRGWPRWTHARRVCRIRRIYTFICIYIYIMYVINTPEESIHIYTELTLQYLHTMDMYTPV